MLSDERPDLPFLVDQAVDDTLAPAEEAALARALARDPSLAAERSSLVALHRLLGADRVPVRRSLATEVMRRLPATGWEARSSRAWRFPVLVTAALLAVAVALVGADTQRLQPGAPLLSVVEAVAGFAAAAALSGAGLLGASWQGLGLALGEALGSVGSRLVFGVGLVALNGLLFFLLRGSGRRLAAQAERRSGAKPGGRERR